MALSRILMNRRTMLRGVGTCLALPWLDAMIARSARAQPASTPSKPPPRMVCCYVPNGVNQAEWTPKEHGANWSLSPTLKAIEGFRTDVTVVSGLCHPRSRGGHSGADTWLTAADLQGTSGKDYQNSISVDQLAAEVHGKHTRFPSLELSFHDGTGTPGWSHSLAFDRTGTPLPAESNPQRLFDRLFTPEGDAAREATLRRYAEQKSVLDEILGDAKSLSRNLGKGDQHKLDEYLASVRETEQRVARWRQWIDVPKPNVSRDALNLSAMPTRLDGSKWLDVMLDLSRLALATDTTRVITFVWEREAAGLAANGADHHAHSHHGGDADMLAKVAVIDRFHVRSLPAS